MRSPIMIQAISPGNLSYEQDYTYTLRQAFITGVGPDRVFNVLDSGNNGIHLEGGLEIVNAEYSEAHNQLLLDIHEGPRVIMFNADAHDWIAGEDREFDSFAAFYDEFVEPGEPFVVEDDGSRSDMEDIGEPDVLKTINVGFDTVSGEGIEDGAQAGMEGNVIILSEDVHTGQSLLDGDGGNNTLEFGDSEPYDLTDLETFDNIDTINTDNVEERLRLADAHVETLGQNWLADDTGITLQQAADSDTVNIGYLVRSDIAANGYDGRIEAGLINNEGFNTVIANPEDAIDGDNDAFHGDTFTAYENLALEGAYAGIPGYDNTRSTNDETVIAGDWYADVAPGGLMDVNEKNVSIDGLTVRYDSIGVWEEDVADVHGTIEIEPWGDNYADGSAEGSGVQNTIVERVGGDSGWQGARAIGIRESDIGIEDNRVLGRDGNGGRSPGNGILVTDGRYPDDIEDYFDDIDPEDAANDVEDVTVAGNEITGFDTAAVALFDKHPLDAEFSGSVEDNDIEGNNRGVALYGDDLVPFTGQADISGNRFSDNAETGIWITGAGTWIDTEEKPAEIIIEENAFHDGSDAVRIGGQYDHGTISIANNELTANGSGTSSIAFGHDFSYGFDGTGTIEFDPVEDGVLVDNTFDFAKLDGIGGSTVIIAEEVDTMADIEDGATGFFDDIADENIVIQTDGTDSRIFVNDPESDQGDKGDGLVESDLQVDVTGVSDLDQFEDAIVTEAPIAHLDVQQPVIDPVEPYAGETFSVEVDVAETAGVETENLAVNLTVSAGPHLPAIYIDETVEPDPLEDSQVTVSFDDLEMSNTGEYPADITVDADNADAVSRDFDLTVVEPEHDYFRVSEVHGDVVTPGETAEVTTTIKNTGDASDTQDVVLTVGYFDPYGMPKLYTDDKEVTLGGLQFEEVTFDMELPEGAVEPGRYSPTVSTDDSEKTADERLIVIGEDDPMVEIVKVEPVLYGDEAVTATIDLWNVEAFEDGNVYLDILGVDGQDRVEATEPGEYEIPLEEPATETGEFKIFAYENADDAHDDYIVSCPGIQNEFFISSEDAMILRAFDGTTSFIYTDPLHSFDGTDGHLDTIEEMESGFTMFDLGLLDLESEETQMLDITEGSLEEAAAAAAEELDPGHHGVFEHDANTYLYANLDGADQSREGDLMIEILGTGFQLEDEWGIVF